MSFRPIVSNTAITFNSDSSHRLMQIYKDYKISQLQEEGAKPKSRTFAPSSIRCSRKSWFRLRGTEPDFLDTPDLAMNFRAEVGVSRHEAIQNSLSKALGNDWIDVGEYLKSILFPYDYEITKSGYETQIYIKDLSIKFACDGIVRVNGKLYLLEIKTCDYDSFATLSTIKTVHKSQVISYASLLKLLNVLVLYEERLNGGMKCFELHISSDEMNNFHNNIKYVTECVESNLAPNRLPTGDYACRNCEYRKKCKEWG